MASKKSQTSSKAGPAKKPEKVFNDRGRKVFRHYIGRGEVLFGAFFVVFTLAMGLWFVSKADDYDPGERDISMEVLETQSVEDNLYRTPFQPWVDPAMASTGGTGPATPDMGIFPAAVLAPGWTPDGRVVQFTNETMYEKIDGQEVQYNQFGCKFLHFITLENAGAEVYVDIELYDMDTFSNALGVFAAQRDADAEVARKGAAYYYATEVGAIGIVDKYYFKIVGNEPNPAIAAEVDTFIEGIGDALVGEGSGGAGGAFGLLADNLAVSFSDIEYVRENVFQFDFAKDFWFGKTAAGVESKYYVHQAGGESDAQALFDQLLEEQLYDYTEVARDGNNVVLQHDFLKTFFTLNVSGAFVFGVDGAGLVEDAQAAVERIRKALTGAEAPAAAPLETTEQ